MYFGGTVVGEQAMKSEDDVGSLIEYEFRVSRSNLVQDAVLICHFNQGSVTDIFRTYSVERACRFLNSEN